MTLILFFAVIYLANIGNGNGNGNSNGNGNGNNNGNGNISGASVCYQCNGASPISNPIIKMMVDNLLRKLVEEKKLDSQNIFCHNLDDLGVEKTCGPGSICYCYSGEFEISVTKEKVAVRSCEKQDPEALDTLGCVDLDSDDGNGRECWCNSNKCNKGSKNRGSGGNFITFPCFRWKKFSEDKLST